MDTNVVTKAVREHADFCERPIYVCLDVHKKSWSVTVYVGPMFFQIYHQRSDQSALQQYHQLAQVSDLCPIFTQYA